MRKNKSQKKGITVLLFTLTLLIISAANGIAEDFPGIPKGWSDRYVYVNGIRIHYYHAIPATEKPVIVMVHGVTDNGLCWTTLSLKLQDKYNIYMLDTRAHGLSDPFTPADDSLTLVKDVVGFVKAMNLEKPILMGHSMGAATVMRLGAEYPDLAKAIIMLDPMLGSFPGRPRGETNKAPKNNVPSTPKQTNQESKNLSINMFGDPEKLVAQNNYNFDDLVAKCHKSSPKWDMVDCQYWALSKIQYHGPYTPEAWKAMSGVMMTGNSLSKISVPALILKADASPEIRKTNEEIARVMQKGKLVHIDGAAHNLHHDDLNRTLKEINEFLAEH